MLSREFHITGRVQGVFFRDRTVRKARDLGVQGWVANNGDGSVTVHAEGPDWAVNDLEEWCRVGPPEAIVTGFDVREAPQEGGEGFTIAY